MTTTPRTKLHEVCIRESRAFFGSLLVDMFGSISNEKGVSDKDKRSLNLLQNAWVRKYNPNVRMPDKVPNKLPPMPETFTIRKRQLSQSEKKSKPAKKPYPQIDILESEMEDLKDVHNNERIAMDIDVPKLYPNWRCVSFVVTVPARIAKERIMEDVLTKELLESLMKMSDKEANEILQELVDNEFSSEIDDALTEG